MRGMVELIDGITHVAKRTHTEDRVSMSALPSTFFSILLQEYSINFRSICVCICIVCMHVCMYVVCIYVYAGGSYEWECTRSLARESSFFSSFLFFSLLFIHVEFSCLSFLSTYLSSSSSSSSSSSRSSIVVNDPNTGHDSHSFFSIVDRYTYNNISCVNLTFFFFFF